MENGYCSNLYSIIIKNSSPLVAESDHTSSIERLHKYKDDKKDSKNFDVFWEEYPNGKGKAYAKQCFDRLKITDELLQKIVDAIKLQKQEREIKERNQEFIPPWKNPSTWLNQHCWDDKIDLTIRHL